MLGIWSRKGKYHLNALLNQQYSNEISSDANFHFKLDFADILHKSPLIKKPIYCISD